MIVTEEPAKSILPQTLDLMIFDPFPALCVPLCTVNQMDKATDKGGNCEGWNNLVGKTSKDETENWDGAYAVHTAILSI